MKYFFPIFIILIVTSLSIQAQNQPGLHVEKNHTVVFGLDTTSVSGSGNTNGAKLMWQPSRAAFRVGNMTSAWNYSNLGFASTALGTDARASGNYSFAAGQGTWANSFGEFSIGRYSLSGGSGTVWNNSTLGNTVFEIGNGTGSNAANRSNMFTVQKSGNVKIGDITSNTETIDEKLVVDGGIVIADAVDPTPAAGTIRWDGTDFLGWDGSSWVSLTSGSSGSGSSAPHLNQPIQSSQGLGWSSVGGYTAHYADNGDAVIFWADSGRTYISQYKNGQWDHPDHADDQYIGSLISSDMNASGKVMFTSKFGTSLYVYELTSSANYTPILGPIATGLTSSSSQISLNDQGDYFVSFLKRISGQDHVHVVGTTTSTPLQISTFGSSATEHRVTYSENGEAVIFWVQPTTVGAEKGLYRSEYNGSSWANMPGLQNHVDKSFNDGGDRIDLFALESSVDGQFILQYDIHERDNFNPEDFENHNLMEKRSGTWQKHNFITSDHFSITGYIRYFNINVSMSDNGNTIYSYNWYDDLRIDDQNGIRRYDVNSGNWNFTSFGFDVITPNFIENDISDSEEIVLSSLFYCGQQKYYLNLDAFNMNGSYSFPNLNEGIGIDGSNVIDGRVFVNNSGSYMTTWRQNGKLLYMIN